VRVAWADEYDLAAGTPPDPRRWRHETGAGGWGNGEVQRYTDDPANAAHDGGGHLVLRAVRDGEAVTSARLVTKGRFDFAYGRLECRASLPAGDGLWAAVWMLGANIDDVGWPACGEIDVVECVGADPCRVFGTVHCPGHAGADGIGAGVVSATPFAGGFHVYAVDWTPEAVAWSVDGRRYHRVTAAALGAAWVFDHPFYILLNPAVGGTLGGPLADAALPAEMAVDYVRVFAPS
jgi:beta-glucanase (GH16 family)